jgi:hypothetical protein
MTRIKKLVWLLSGLLAALLLTGCIMVGTFVIDYEFASDAPFDGLVYYDIDLTEEPDWEDHQDDIKNIDNVGFILRVTNDEDDDLDVQMYIDDIDNPIYDNKDDVEDNTDLILNNVTFAADDVTVIDWPTSLTKIENVGVLKSLVESGEFRIYMTSSQPNVDIVINFGVIIVTVTAGE